MHTALVSRTADNWLHLDAMLKAIPASVWRVEPGVVSSHETRTLWMDVLCEIRAAILRIHAGDLQRIAGHSS